MTKNGVCAKCGQRIIGLAKHAYGQTLCQSCYEKVMKSAQKSIDEKHELENYICQLFSISECPSPVSFAIESALKQGKKISGIRGTLYYFYQIQGHSTGRNDIQYIGYVIKTEYENARQYFANQREIAEINKSKKINTEPINVTLDMKKVHQKRNIKIDYKIEDL